jgi:hypothetical protein
MVHGHRHPGLDQRSARGHPASGRHRGKETKVLIDQVRTIDVSYIDGDLMDYLSRDDMAQVEHSLSRYLGLPY